MELEKLWNERVPAAVRRSARETRANLRRPTHQLRRLPDFLIIGSQRCGTTSLYNYLGAHPDVRTSLGKELQYFTLYFGRGERWYRSRFPVEHRGRPFLTFEATPYYLYHPVAPARAAATVPGAKLIALVRNPVDRAFSHWQHSRRLGLEYLDFDGAICAEEQRTFGEADRLRRWAAADQPVRSYPHQAFSYVARGHYADQLEAWFDHFPHRQVLVIRSEDMYEQPAEVYHRVLEFLGLRPFTPAQFEIHTRSSRAGSPMSDETRARLAAHFAEPNRKLEELLGWETSWD